MADNKDKDATPIEPLMARKRSSQSAMVAIGWRTCPNCDAADVYCVLCWDEESQQFARRVAPDVYIKWIQEHKTKIETHDTEPEMPAVKPEGEKS